MTNQSLALPSDIVRQLNVLKPMGNKLDIENDDKLLEWFENIEASGSTRRLYTIFMRVFCEGVGKTPSELIQEAIQELKQGLLPAERKSTSYLAKYKKCMTDKGYSPKSFNTGMAVIRSFYKAFDIPLSNTALKTKKARPMRENQTFLTKDDVKKMVVNAKNLREKAIFLCMSTSGMARQEIISLKIKDITFDENGIGTLSIRRQKSQTDYTTFISPEAVQTLRNYWDERNRESKTAIKSTEDYVFVTYTTGKQLDPNTFGLLFNILGNELGYQNGEGYIKSRSHALRKFFASTLENAGMPKNKVDYMLGHVTDDTDFAYFKTDINKLKELYKKYLPYLTFEKTIEVRSLDVEDAKKLEKLSQDYEELKRQMELITSTLQAKNS
jgi:integrase